MLCGSISTSLILGMACLLDKLAACSELLPRGKDVSAVLPVVAFTANFTGPAGASHTRTQRGIKVSWGSASGNWTFCRVNRVVPEWWALGAFPSIREMGADCIHRGTLAPQWAGTFPVDPDAVMARADRIA